MSGLRGWNSKAGRSMLAGFTAGLLLLLLLAFAVPADELPQVGRLVPGIHTRALRVGDRERRYRVCVPRSYDGQKAVPVVLVFHGGGGDPDGMMKLCGMNAKAEQAGFIAVYPYGTGRFAGRLLSFNGGECCGYAHDNSIWFTIGGQSAASFGANEVPAVLQDICDLRILQLPTLLESLLRDYDLEYGERTGGMSTILSRRRAAAESSKYGAAEIRIDTATRLVRQVSLERIEDGRVVALMTFTLRELRQQPNGMYHLKTHLQSDSVVLERGGRVGARAELLREFLQQLR